VDAACESFTAELRLDGQLLLAVGVRRRATSCVGEQLDKKTALERGLRGAGPLDLVQTRARRVRLGRLFDHFLGIGCERQRVSHARLGLQALHRGAVDGELAEQVAVDVRRADE